MNATANWDGHPAGQVAVVELSEEERREIAIEISYDRFLDAAGLE